MALGKFSIRVITKTTIHQKSSNYLFSDYWSESLNDGQHVGDYLNLFSFEDAFKIIPGKQKNPYPVWSGLMLAVAF